MKLLLSTLWASLIALSVTTVVAADKYNSTEKSTQHNKYSLQYNKVSVPTQQKEHKDRSFDKT